MGRMIDGAWDSRDRISADERGAFLRAATKFRDQVTEVEPDRYHLYLSYACPWAHRTLIVRALLGLEEAISVSVADPFMGERGWVIGGRPLWEWYVAARPDYTGRVTVPVLWDKKHETIVNNESVEIIRMFDTLFRPLCTKERELFRPGVDAVIEGNYNCINNGVYRCGFAQTQEAYDEAVDELFSALDRNERVLGERPFLCGDELTAADICLFTTLFRFDLVYHTHFKCNVRRLIDYPNLWPYAKRIYALPEVAATCRPDHIKEHYYRSHESINPRRIVPKGPEIDWSAP